MAGSLLGGGRSTLGVCTDFVFVYDSQQLLGAVTRDVTVTHLDI